MVEEVKLLGDYFHDLSLMMIITNYNHHVFYFLRSNLIKMTDTYPSTVNDNMGCRLLLSPFCISRHSQLKFVAGSDCGPCPVLLYVGTLDSDANRPPSFLLF